ncbi:recombination protein NinG [Candidatus Pacearchaeota archaeon]|nr:recombination protein NinG [Candidatus Pacearchaeota archaeon]
MANSKRRCKFCRDYFPVDEMTKVPAGWFCCFDHTLAFLREKQRKDKEKAHRERKKAFYDKERPRQLKLAQKAFNDFIRFRDRDLPCISCGTTSNIQYAAGHYRTRGSAGHLRFNQFNTNKQCNKNCNLSQSGNIGEYRIGLIKKWGIAKVEELESANEIKKLTVEEVIDIKFYYLRLLKAVKEV